MDYSVDGFNDYIRFNTMANYKKQFSGNPTFII